MVLKGDNSSTNRRFTAVILAAGYSSRMKRFKPLLPVGKYTAVERLIRETRKAGIEYITVVTGYRRDELAPVIKALDVDEAYNADFDKGMFSSIKKGLQNSDIYHPDTDGYFIIPADCPLISSTVIRKMIGDVKDDMFCVPVFEGKKGHPLYIPRMYLEEICRYNGSGGLKAVTDRYLDKIWKVAVGDEGCILDMDTPEGYEDILEFLSAGRHRDDIMQLAEGRRVFLIRHGQTMQHDEKMMIGQYDVPLNDEGREQMRAAAGRIAEFDPRPDFVYSSDLCRAAESADIVVNEMISAGVWPDSMEIIPVREFREIALGSWDGLPIREIMEKYPQEYERRGRDIFSFKKGNGAENFYDMQYRAVNRLRKILKKDDARDIVIVAHSGVIRALDSNMRGHRIDDQWRGVSKGGFIVIE